MCRYTCVLLMNMKRSRATGSPFPIGYPWFEIRHSAGGGVWLRAVHSGDLTAAEPIVLPPEPRRTFMESEGLVIWLAIYLHVPIGAYGLENMSPILQVRKTQRCLMQLKKQAGMVNSEGHQIRRPSLVFWQDRINMQ
jgi:hypothetical protein